MLPAHRTLFVLPTRRLLMLLMLFSALFALLCTTPARASAPFVASFLAANNDGQTHLLWANVDGRINLMAVQEDGSMIFGNTLDGNMDDDGTQGWQAVGLTSAFNGLSVVLWRSREGAAKLWTLSPDGKMYTSGDTYGPYAGWTPISVASGTDGTVYFLWANTDGRMTFWTVDAPGTGGQDGGRIVNYSPIYGPFAGWHPSAVRIDESNNAHIVWLHDDGSIVTWQVSFSGGYVQLPEYTPSPGAGWNVQAVSLSKDGLTHFLWNNAAAGANLWNLNDESLLNYSAVYSAPTGWLARDIAGRADGSNRMLWTNTNGTAAVWLIDANNNVLNYGNPMGSFAGPYY